MNWPTFIHVSESCELCYILAITPLVSRLFDFNRVRRVCLFQNCQYLCHPEELSSSVASWCWSSSPADERGRLSSCLTGASGSTIVKTGSRVTHLRWRDLIYEWSAINIRPYISLLGSDRQRKINLLRYSRHHVLSMLNTASAYIYYHVY